MTNHNPNMTPANRRAIYSRLEEPSSTYRGSSLPLWLIPLIIVGVIAGGKLMSGWGW